MKFASSLVFFLPLLVEQASAGVVGRGAAKQDIGANVGAAAAANAAAAAASSSAAAAAKATAVKATAAKAATSAAAKAVSTAAKAAATVSSAAAVVQTGSAAAAATVGGDLQSSLTLDPSVIAKGFADDGQDVPTAGQIASLTSTNNFINFCATVPQLPITNGQQIKTGSCNPAPMGIIAATTNMPSSKFVFPKNLDNIEENTAFTIQMAVSNLDTGNFVNADSNYYSAPQITVGGNIKGHTHVTVELMSGLDQTTTTNPTVFAFFKGVNGAAVNGIVTADVTNGLPAGTYRLASINTAENHQPCLVAVAQHGSLDDMVYFTVGSAAQAAAAKIAGASVAAASNSTAASSAAPKAASSVAVKATATSAAAKGAKTSAAAKPVSTPAKAPAAPAKGSNQNNANKGGQAKGGNQNERPFGFGGFKREARNRMVRDY
ncbi:hypothetical protein BV25DRAFT_448253 [Artomyces pyxidatus]|uniref:Uncharacterized protein n=1 Tax=Artomyces pyxidatus TaxID=48021 RepID=A0ACB8T4U5_9AGAM|nr:hypothetical protein BV25DRAFT_448253 [Artomyces pyxidatus]